MKKYLNISKTIVYSIDIYRLYLSPIKGYKCAYGVSGGGYTCSSYGKKVYSRFGPLVATKLMKRQFIRCHERAITMNAGKGILVGDACGVPICCWPDGSNGRGC